MFLQLHQYANDWKWQLKASVNSKIDRWCTFVITSLKFVHIFHEKKTRSVSGVMVSIVAFQAVDRGSIPRWRKHIFCSILGWSIVWFIHPSVRPLVSDESTFLHILEGSKNFLPALPNRTGLWQPFIQPCYFLQKLKKILKKRCQEWDLSPRPHMWTRIVQSLNSGALDRLAILACM